jgi:hypothetical protein
MELRPLGIRVLWRPSWQATYGGPIFWNGDFSRASHHDRRHLQADWSCGQRCAYKPGTAEAPTPWAICYENGGVDAILAGSIN